MYFRNANVSKIKRNLFTNEPTEEQLLNVNTVHIK